MNFNYSDTSSGEGQYYHNGVFTPVRRLNYLGNARVIVINNHGMVVGGSLNAAGLMRAFIYDAAGMSQTADGEWHGFLYRNGAMTDIGLMEQYSPLDLDINDAGQIIGKGWLNGAYRPMLLENGVMTDVQTLIDPAERFQLWEVEAINDHGQIVGTGCHTSPIGSGLAPRCC